MPAKAKPTTTFAARLRALREQAGLTAYALAQRSGVSRQALSRLEQDQQPNWETVCRLADALGVPTDAFRGDY